MRLEGYRCDECKTESREKPGIWIQTQAVRVNSSGLAGGYSASFSEGLHYCSTDCLLAAVPKWKGQR